MNKEILLNSLNNAKFKRVKAKMIVEALNSGIAQRGNHVMYYKGSTVNFQYRGTIIAELSLDDLTVEDIDAGEFNNTVATIRQRKEITEAVHELRKVAGLC